MHSRARRSLGRHRVILGPSIPLGVTSGSLGLGDTVLIWADTKLRKDTDKAPNTESGDGCAKPEVASEVISLELN